LISTSASVVGDIGCDHGLLAASIAEYNNISKVYALDISSLAIENCKRNLAERSIDIQKKITILEGDGLKPILLEKTVVDCIVVAGMGTNTAREICNENDLDFIKCKEIVFQPWPPHLIPVLNLYNHLLDTNNWMIKDQRIVQNGEYQHLTTSFVRSYPDLDGGTNKNSILTWPLTKRLSKDMTKENKIFIQYLTNQNNNFFRVKKNKAKSAANHDNDIITNTEKDIAYILEKYTKTVTMSNNNNNNNI